jgi:hypothetical protein
MYNTGTDNIATKMKWTQIVLIVALILCLTGLGTVSIVSFFQTETAFRGLNDPNIPMLGMAISYAFAFIFQYGQNAALYIRKKFCSGKTVFTLFSWDVTDKDLLMAAFCILAAVDAITNIVWFYSTVEANPDKFIDGMVKFLGYSAMILAVFVEEALGAVLDALSRALKELKSLMDWGRKSRGTNNTPAGFRPIPRPVAAPAAVLRKNPRGSKSNYRPSANKNHKTGWSDAQNDIDTEISEFASRWDNKFPRR